jgi:small subunit ribosomal protein S21
MIGIHVRNGESIDKALKRFKQKCQQAGMHRDVKRASFYLKPSEKKKIARNMARRRYKKLFGDQ